MPLHRVSKDTPDELDLHVKAAENNGERVVQVLDTPDEWLIFTAVRRGPWLER